jgi:hypothetical protein
MSLRWGWGERKGDKNKKQPTAWERFCRAEEAVYAKARPVDDRTKWKRYQRMIQAYKILFPDFEDWCRRQGIRRRGKKLS